MTRTILFLIGLLLAVTVTAKDIIPVKTWPSTIYLPDKVITGASVNDCVRAGYRLIPAKPATPVGKRIKSEKLVQDDKDIAKCKYEIVYEDIPVLPPPPPPEVLTNVPSAKVTFNFTTKGQYRGVVWTDAPKTNVIK